MERKEAEEKALEMAGIPKKQIVLMNKFTPKIYAAPLLNKTKFLYDNYKRFWRYDNKEGLWKEDAERYIKFKLRKEILGDEEQQKHFVDEVVSYIKDLCWNEKDVNNPPKNIIAFKNCLYDIDKEEIIDFNERYFITIKIPVNIDSQYNECPKIDQFLEDFIGEKKQLLYELVEIGRAHV